MGMALTLFYDNQGIKHSLVRGWSQVKLPLGAYVSETGTYIAPSSLPHIDIRD
jgi:hypothetical protein